MQSFTSEQIIDKGKQLGFTYRSFNFFVEGKYKASDAFFNHRDIPHFNHLHANLAGGYGNEGVYYGDVACFIRYFKLIGFSFPILCLLKEDGKNKVLETYSFFIFQFLKINKETEIPGKGCRSDITYHVGAKNKFLLSLFAPIFEKMFIKSFNDYKNDDLPFLNRRAELRENNFYFSKDDTSSFTFGDTLDIKKQNCFFDYKNIKKEKIIINLKDLKNNEMKSFGNLKILSFQIFKGNNNIKIFPLICPHEGGHLGINNKVGLKFTNQDFINSGCKVRCNVHNRRFDPIFDINLNNDKNTYQSNVYDLVINNDEISIEMRPDIDKNLTHDWSTK